MSEQDYLNQIERAESMTTTEPQLWVDVWAQFPDGKRWADFLREIDMIDVDTERPDRPDGSQYISGAPDFIRKIIAYAQLSGPVLVREVTDDIGKDVTHDFVQTLPKRPRPT